MQTAPKSAQPLVPGTEQFCLGEVSNPSMPRETLSERRETVRVPKIPKKVTTKAMKKSPRVKKKGAFHRLEGVFLVS